MLEKNLNPVKLGTANSLISENLTRRHFSSRRPGMKYSVYKPTKTKQNSTNSTQFKAKFPEKGRHLQTMVQKLLIFSYNTYMSGHEFDISYKKVL